MYSIEASIESSATEITRTANEYETGIFPLKEEAPLPCLDTPRHPDIKDKVSIHPETIVYASV